MVPPDFRFAKPLELQFLLVLKQLGTFFKSMLLQGSRLFLAPFCILPLKFIFERELPVGLISKN